MVLVEQCWLHGLEGIAVVVVAAAVVVVVVEAFAGVVVGIHLVANESVAVVVLEPL